MAIIERIREYDEENACAEGRTRGRIIVRAASIRLLCRRGTVIRFVYIRLTRGAYAQIGIPWLGFYSRWG